MKIVHFVPGLGEIDGGPGRSVPRLSLALRRAGADVDLLYSHERGALSAETSDAASGGVSVRKLSSPASDRAAAVRGADIVHLHGLWSLDTHFVGAAAHRARTLVVLSPRGMLEPWALRQRRLRKTIAWYAFQRKDVLRAGLIHATSELEAANIAALVPAAAIVTVPNGTDLPPFAGDARPRRQILFLSRLHKKKGVPLLVDAAARLAAGLRAGGWTVVIAGPDEGGYAAEIERRIKEARVGDFVKMIGPVDGARKWQVYRESSVFVLPTHSENFGLVVAEALAAGVPVITTTGTPWRELRELDCGWWIEPTVDALTTALREVLATSPAELAEKGRRGRRLVEEKYSWHAAGDAMLATYERALQSRKR